jgi:hypothetical protein
MLKCVLHRLSLPFLSYSHRHMSWTTMGKDLACLRRHCVRGSHSQLAFCGVNCLR